MAIAGGYRTSNYMEESIYNLIPKIQEKPPKPSRYVEFRNPPCCFLNSSEGLTLRKNFSSVSFKLLTTYFKNMFAGMKVHVCVLHYLRLMGKGTINIGKDWRYRDFS